MSVEYQKFKTLITKIGFEYKVQKNIIVTIYKYKKYTIQIDPIFNVNQIKNDGSFSYDADDNETQYHIFFSYNRDELFNLVIETDYEKVEKVFKFMFKYELRFLLRKEKINKLLEN